MNIPGYDAWKLQSPYETDYIGIEPGECCNRINPPEEYAPRGYKPKPCIGELIEDGGVIICDTCGELVV